MEIQDLEYFLTLREICNVSRAADEIAISQSSLSKRLAAIEHEIGGISLFDRTQRPIELTAAGEEFSHYAERILQEHHDLMASMLKYLAQEDNVLRIGSIPIMNRFGITALIRSFRKGLDTGQSISVIDRDAQMLLSMLEREEIDVAIIVTDPKHRPGKIFTSYELNRNEMSLVVGSEHRYASRRSVMLEDLRNERIVLPDRNNGMHDYVHKELIAIGVPERNFRTCSGIETMLDLVEDDGCVAIMSKRLLDSYTLTGIEIIQIQPKIDNCVTLVVKNTRRIGRLTQIFIDYALKRKNQL